ncbi:hypothetical protein JDFR1000234_58 [uncultured archaeal virus]|jgi:hypothetical protein|uniref:Uncharacterized protein n=1 Tax=uncultured archaeal virus TaxID=1960247 RepID=A0A1S5Y388_9VIRU|nr:hypothetical protein JDFR1000234_58 [uncultured archaeal virus]
MEEEWKIKAMLISGARTPEEQQLMVYYLCAMMFGWTPNQVDEISINTLRRLLLLVREIKRRQELWQKNLSFH